MAASAGQLGLVQINNSTYQTVTGIKTAEIAVNNDLYDITDLNSNTWKIMLPGLADYTLKLAGNFDLSDAQQAVLEADIITTPGTSVAWRVYPKGTGGTHYFSGSGFIKGYGVKVDVKSENTSTFDITGSGAISYT